MTARRLPTPPRERWNLIYRCAQVMCAARYNGAPLGDLNNCRRSELYREAEAVLKAKGVIR
jgi:hypothetical protein